MTKNRSTEFCYTEQTVGLPDFLYVSPTNGKPDEGMLARAVGIPNRHHKKASLNCIAQMGKKRARSNYKLTEGKYPLIDAYALPYTRLKLFLIAIRGELKKFRESGQYNPAANLAPSLEMTAFIDFAPELLRDPSIYQVELTESHGIDKSIIEGPLSSSDSVKVGIQVSLAVKAKAFSELLSYWDAASEERRQKLAAIVHGVATIFQPGVMNEAFSIRPQLKAYFTNMLGLPCNQVMAFDSQSQSEESPLLAQYSSHEQWQDDIQIILDALRGDSGSQSLREKLVERVASYHNWASSQQDREKGLYALNELTKALARVARGHGIDDPCVFEMKEAYAGFVCCWEKWAIEQQSQSTSGDQLVEQTSRRWERLKSHCDTIGQQQEALNTARYSLDLLERKGSFDGRGSRRLATEKTAATSRIAQIEHALSLAKEDYILDLLPEGADLEDLDAGGAPVQEKAFKNSIIEVMNRLRSWLEEEFLIGKDTNLTVVDETEGAHYEEVVTEDIFGEKLTASKLNEGAEDLSSDGSDSNDAHNLPASPSEAPLEITISTEASSKDVNADNDSVSNSNDMDLTELASIGKRSAALDSALITKLAVGHSVGVPPKNDGAEASIIDLHKNAIEQAKSEEGRRALSSLATNVYINGGDVNAALTRQISYSQVAAAAQLAYAIEKRKLSDGFIPYALLKAAYYGMNTFDDRAVFNKSRRQLLAIDNGQFEEWIGLPNADMVPYLMLLATFQPALFGGNSSTAFTRLREIPEAFFDGATKSLIDGMTQVANRGEQATIALLRAGGEARNEVTVFDSRPLTQWIQKIREARRGYAPVLKSQAYCLDHGEFKKITEILLTNDRQQHGIVEDFVATYQDQDATNSLLVETLSIINVATGEGITRIGKQRFYHKVMELVHLAKDWLEVVGHAKGSALESFCKGFTTRLAQSITYFDMVAKDPGSSPGRQAGAALTAVRFKELLAIVSSPKQPWPYRRVKGWYYHPRDIAAMDLPFASDSSPEVIQWILARIGGELCTLETLKRALVLAKVRLAELLRLKLEEDGVAVGEVNTRDRFLEVQRHLVAQCIDLEAKLEDALLAGLIDSGRAELFSDQLSDALETVEQTELLDDIDEVQSNLEDIDLELKKRTAREKQALQDRYEKDIQRLRLAVPDKPVADDWIYDLESAFRDDNIPVINEMLDELNDAVTATRRIEPIRIKNIPVLREFLAQQDFIYKGVMSDISASKRSLWHGVVEGGSQFGLNFEHVSTASKATLKKAFEALAGWSSGKPPSEMGQDLYQRLVAVMEVLGVRAKEAQYSNGLRAGMNYQTAIGFSSVRMSVLPSPSTRPFTLFGSRRGGGGQLPVMIAYKPWEPESLGELMASHSIHDEALLISAVPLSVQQRDTFAQWCKRNQHTILHVDVVMLLFLGAQVSDSVENIYVRNFLWLTAPFTYFNPYGGENMIPPFPEMRYGREKQITKLLRMENGAAIVYGGRQLGKSTILKEVEHRFHQPNLRKYAFYEMLDKDLDKRIDISLDAHHKARRRIWDFMHLNLKKYGLIDKSQETPDIDSVINSVKESLMRHQDASFIVIFDEIDPVLNVDSHYDFSIFRGLRDLVAHRDVVGRFKVIIGGLENVKRFENSPNYPLTQMGSTTPVKILPTQEAIHLVTEPLLAAGYRFENGRAANRILATTNRHPGLIQVFCHELVDYLCNNRKVRIGSCVITNEDVESVARKQKVLDLIRNRFDMTLNLDDRYLVIVYGIIDDGRGAQPFTTEYAKSVAEVWLPAAFGQLSHRQFEAFLDELVGLGVLRKNNDGRFALRNTNVLKLLADVQGDDVGHQLERAIKNYNNYDPMDRHAFDPAQHPVPSPITYRDERAIIGAGFGDAPDAAEPALPDIRHKFYTTTVVTGSQAQGLSELVKTLPSIYEEESAERGSRGNQTEYAVYTCQSADYKSAAEFEKKLMHPLMSKKAMEAPQMVFIETSIQTPLVDLLGMIDATHRYTPAQGVTHYPVRLLFLMGPDVYWNWLRQAKITKSRERLQPFIKLGNWSAGAVRALLEKLHMNDSSSAVEETLDASQGWYLSLKIIARTRLNHPNWVGLSQFGGFTPMTKLDRKFSGQFLEQCGINVVPWAKALLRLLVEQADETLDRYDLELFAEEAGLELSEIGGIDSALRWLLDMGLLVSCRKTDGKAAYYAIAPAIRHAIRIHELHEPA